MLYFIVKIHKIQFNVMILKSTNDSEFRAIYFPYKKLWNKRPQPASPAAYGSQLYIGLGSDKS